MNETGWTCDQCGEFNASTAVCTSCGAALEGAKTRQGVKQVSRRVSEAEVARILNLVAATPNLRESPAPGDMVGDFHTWFDGGAQRIDTGTQTDFLEDGTKVFAIAPVMWISLIIEFPDGESVVVEQVRERV